jgi:hypothetical protein
MSCTFLGMTVHSARFDLDVPDDFPIDLLEATHAQISDPDDARRQTDEWREWAGACNGLLYRFLACAGHSDSLVSSLEASTSPPQPERYEQEKLLFDFFAEGLSALECLYYGVYFMGALVDPSQVDSGQARRKIVPWYVTESFEAAFPGDAMTARLRAVLDNTDHRNWREARNILTHRAAPGRDFRTGGDDAGTYWMGGTLDADAFVSRRAWLASTIEEMLASFQVFASARLN